MYTYVTCTPELNRLFMCALYVCKTVVNVMLEIFAALQVGKMPKPVSEPSSPSASRCSTPTVHSDTEEGRSRTGDDEDDSADSEEEREELGLTMLVPTGKAASPSPSPSQSSSVKS